MSRVTIRSRARLDVLEQHDWYVTQEALIVAERFVIAVTDTADQLLDSPAAGRIESFDHPRLVGVRSIGVSGFPATRLFYLSTPEGIDILRALHVARDIVGILKSE